jgi:hypothetical protein
MWGGRVGRTLSSAKARPLTRMKRALSFRTASAVRNLLSLPPARFAYTHSRPRMPTITALLHTHNDALRLGRCLETLYPCDEILILDHASTDDTPVVAREYGAHVIAADSQAQAKPHSHSAWLLCLDPRESLTESLAATLYEWKLTHFDARPPSAFSVVIREETTQGWSALSAPATRLVPPDWTHWSENFPISDRHAAILDGEILRFSFP